MYVLKVEEVLIEDVDDEETINEKVLQRENRPGLKEHLKAENAMWRKLEGRSITFIHLFNENW